MSKVYLPIEVNSNQCAVMVSDGHIRIYDNQYSGSGSYGQDIHYYDFYIRDNYIETEGTNRVYNSLNCMSNEFTTDIYYRNDFDKILIIFFIILIVGLWFPYKIISRLFGRWLKI